MYEDEIYQNGEKDNTGYGSQMQNGYSSQPQRRKPKKKGGFGKALAKAL